MVRSFPLFFPLHESDAGSLLIHYWIFLISVNGFLLYNLKSGITSLSSAKKKPDGKALITLSRMENGPFQGGTLLITSAI